MDALCINQANVNERNHQVGLMNMIYQQAVCVHTCIQDPLHDRSRCMRWLNAGEGHPKVDDRLKKLSTQLVDLEYFNESGAFKRWYRQEG